MEIWLFLLALEREGGEDDLGGIIERIQKRWKSKQGCAAACCVCLILFYYYTLYSLLLLREEIKR